MNRSCNRREKEAWLAVALWVLLIYTSVPLVNTLQIWVKDTFGSMLFLYLTVAGLAAGAVAGVVLIRRSTAKLSLRAGLWVAAIAAVAIGWAFHLRGQPQEAVHLLEYGALGLLATNALRYRSPDPTVFLQAILLGAIVGVVDEIIQWITPDRYFDFRDFWLNGGAIALMQLALWQTGIVNTPKTVAPASVRRLCRLGIAYLALLLACLSATPSVVEGIARRMPPLAAFIDQQDPMAEYGHRHTVPEIGSFKSRFTLAELDELDRSRGREVGKMIRPLHQGGLFRHFFKEASRAHHPFAREVRMHVACRNQNLKHAEDADDEVEATYRITRTVRENRILETCYGESLASAGWRFGPARRTELENGANPEMHFYSMADRHLITFASQRTLLVCIGLLLVALVVADRLAGRRHSPESSL